MYRFLVHRVFEVSNMGLFRIAAAATVAIALMPSDANEQKRLYERAEQAVAWSATFCERNPESCERANSIAETMKRKAQFAGAMIYDLTVKQVGQIVPSTAAIPPLAPVSYSGAAEVYGPAALDRGTLQEADLLTPWTGQGPAEG
ncbi:MAG: DUF5330 domain-containing protein [Hyphomicrobium sp.]|nr:DUF5330 domain-containing protein [Hyphomicrobium sp.]